MIKRLFDICISLLIALFLSPVMALVMILIRLESKGAPIFSQRRIGINGKEFSIYKFRSMVADAADRGPYFTQKNDSRITHVGQVIRKTSIDELPQLINVLRGDMSLVGPRPNVSAQRSEYSEIEWVKRNSIRPGITGLAQALLRSAATETQRTKLDLEYVDKSSLFFDIKIIIMTIKQVIMGVGN